jgi:hypothetical protein
MSGVVGPRLSTILTECEKCALLGLECDCAGICDGDTVVDECGVCGGSGIPDGESECP